MFEKISSIKGLLVPGVLPLVLLLYAVGNASQGMIAKLLGVSHVTVHRWLRRGLAGRAQPPVEIGRAHV